MKRLISIILAMNMFLMLVPQGVFAADDNALQIGVLSDVHYFPSVLTGNYCNAFMDYVATNTRQEAQSEALLESALYAIAAHSRENGLKYLLITGDNTRDGEYEGHRLFAERLERFEDETGIQVIVTNGNHDINNGGAATFENGVKEKTRVTTPEDWLDLYKNLGYDLAYHTFTPDAGKKGGMLSYSVRFDGGYRLIVLDSCKYSWDTTSDGENQHEGEGVYSPELLDWVLAETADAQAKGEKIIGMTHHSLVPHFDIEPSLMPTLILDNWAEVGEVLADAGMRYVFTGHTHMSDIATGVSDNGATLTDICTASLTGYPNTFREVLFDRTASGFSADVKTCDVDCEKQIVFKGLTYAGPYRDSFSFGQSFGHNGLGQYAVDLIDQYVSKNLEMAQGDGLVNMLDTMGFDLEAMVKKIIGSGLAVGNFNIFSPKNIMGFINDLAAQIESNYINEPERIKAIVQTAIGKLAYCELSDIPSTKFLDSPGFGDSTGGGNLEEFGQSLVTYMFNGDEDLSNDLFMSDALAKIESGEFTDMLVKLLTEIILDDLLSNNILSTLKLNISSVFVNDISRETLGAFLDFSLRVMLGGDNSYRSLIEFMLRIGAVGPQNVHKLIDEMLALFVDETDLDSTLALWVRSLITDSNPGLRNDNNVYLNDTGTVPVVASEQNMRLPTEVLSLNGSNRLTSETVTWYTKFSVTASDIEIIPYSKNPVFTGIPTTGAGISSHSELVSRSYNALDLSVFGTFLYKSSQVLHTVELTGLQPNRKYLYRVGDASKGWWSSTRTLDTYFWAIDNDDLGGIQALFLKLLKFFPVIFKVLKLLT